MKTTIFSLLFTFLGCNSFAQTETAAYKTIADKFELHYNAGNYDSIFSMLDVIMQNALPPEKTNEFFTGLKAQAGQIKKKEFIKYSNGTVAVYKTNFERALFAINISVDKNLKINGLFVKPFVDESQSQTLRNATKLILPFNDEWTVVWGGDTKEQNYHVMVGGIDADNAASIKLHLKFGFVHSGTVTQSGFKFGRWLNVAFYQLTLPTPAHPVDG